MPHNSHEFSICGWSYEGIFSPLQKSFILKPFEFTKFSDLPQNGYDPDKIAYYENYEILKKQDATGENDPTGNLSNDYNRDSDSIFFKNNIGYEKPNLKHGCCKIFLEDQDIDEQYPVSDIDVSITNMIKKLHEFNLAPDPNYNSINNENKDRWWLMRYEFHHLLL